MNKKKIIIFLASALAIFGLFFISSTNPTPEPVQDNASLNLDKPVSPEVPIQPVALNTPENQKAILEINGEKTETEIEAKITVYDFMKKLEDESKIAFTEKNYSGIGKLITSINGQKSNNEMTWIFYVNGIEATKGVSDYKITSGDVVSWKYEEIKY